jgi:hypothetical protein
VTVWSVRSDGIRTYGADEPNLVPSSSATCLDILSSCFSSALRCFPVEESSSSRWSWT